jgi:uncharacterized coiled-coil protein SlyX
MYKDQKMLSLAILCLFSYVHAFNTIEAMNLAERLTALENNIVNQRFGIWHDERRADSIPRTSLIHEMESRIRALENRVGDQDVIIAKLKNVEELNHSLKKTVEDLKIAMIENDHRYQELETKVDNQERLIADLRQRTLQTDRQQANDYDSNVMEHKQNNSSFTTMIGRNKTLKRTRNTRNKDMKYRIQRKYYFVTLSRNDH